MESKYYPGVKLIDFIPSDKSFEMGKRFKDGEIDEKEFHEWVINSDDFKEGLKVLKKNKKRIEAKYPGYIKEQEEFTAHLSINN